MAARNHSFGWLFSSLSLLVLLGGGCGEAPAPKEEESPGPVHARIPESTLSEHGLETLWYSPSDPADNPVQLVELATEGLFIATTPTEEKQGRLKMLSRASGGEQWRYKLSYPLASAPSVYRYPRAVAGNPDEVFFAQLDQVFCVDLKYGALLWSVEIPHSVSTKVVADELNFFLGSDNGRAYGFDKKSSVEEWPFRTGGTILSSPLVFDNSIYFASTDGSIYRLFAARPGWVTGSSWEFKSGARIMGDPIAFARWVIFGSTDYKLYCLESKDGSEYWSFPAESPIESAPVVYSHRANQEYVYCIAVHRKPSAKTRTLFSVRLRDGKEVWRKTGMRKVVAQGVECLYVLKDTAPSEGRWLAALDVATGEEKFQIPVDGFDFVPLNSADSGRDPNERGKIYLVARDGTIQVLTEKL